MDNETLKDALKQETNQFSDADWKLVEIGDGNINRVFRATAPDGRTCVIKRAQRSANISSSICLNIDRGELEYAYLQEIARLMPDRVPAVYGYSKKDRAILMQDTAPAYAVLQKEIVQGKQPAFLANQLADYVAVAGCAFSDFSLPSVRKKALQKRFVNPKLCELTETLVFTEPYHPCENNRVSDESRDFVAREIYEDPAVSLAAAKLKYRFMNCPQSLIHGDLHFGSVFLGVRDILVFDPEFCFFGPIGYDLGNLLAHFALHHVYAAVTRDTEAAAFCVWLRQSAVSMVTAFADRFLQQAEGCAAFPLDRYAFIQAFLEDVLRDTAGYAGTECIRRVIGLAKVSAFRFENEQKKSQYEMRALSVGKELLTQSEAFTSPEVFEGRLNKLLR